MAAASVVLVLHVHGCGAVVGAEELLERKDGRPLSRTLPRQLLGRAMADPILAQLHDDGQRKGGSGRPSHLLGPVAVVVGEQERVGERERPWPAARWVAAAMWEGSGMGCV